MPIDNITLEKRCIKYLLNMINSNCKLYHNIVNLSLNNVSTSIGENLRYFMYKYMIQEYDWYETYSHIKCQIYTHSSEKLRNYFILFVCCSFLSIILKEVYTLQMKSLGSLF